MLIKNGGKSDPFNGNTLYGCLLKLEESLFTASDSALSLGTILELGVVVGIKRFDSAAELSL